MNKQEIKVPAGIKYMSDWGSYRLPQGHCIVDKGVTGCGYTEYCLTNDLPLVLCSPRKLLLENKAEQHEGEKNILYLRNDVKDYEGVKDLREKVREHITLTCNEFFGGVKGVPKILVTYDSSHYVIDALQEIGELENFYFVVDEFQSIFLDSFFKSEVEFDFVQNLQVCRNVLYLSATPMLDKYLEKVEEFKDLDFQILDWSETGIVENVIIKRKFAKSLVSECRDIIQRYKVGKFEMELLGGGKVVVSDEGVFFFNNIGDILEIIRKELLMPWDVNIICADTEDNRKKIRKLTKDMESEHKDLDLGEGYKIGRIPLRGEKNPMFTFCTKTAYIGADFYSPCASTYVFADPNINSLALDISLDLPQIVGRQRDRENPFKNNITIFYRTIRKKEMENRGAFEEKQNQRRRSTQNLLELYKKASPEEQQDYLKKLRSDIKVSQYSDDFVSISKKTNLPVHNSFIEIANERAWDVSQKDYQDKISVTKALEKVSKKVEVFQDDIEKLVSDFLDKEFYSTGIFRQKMKMYCEFMDKHKGDFNQELQDLIYFKIKDDRFRKYYNYYGTSGCRSVRYEEHSLYEGMRNVSKEGELWVSIEGKFKVGQSYTKKEIKFILGNLYRDLGISKTPKATDLEEYFVLERARFTDPDTKKRIEGFKLISYRA